MGENIPLLPLGSRSSSRSSLSHSRRGKGGIKAQAFQDILKYGGPAIAGAVASSYGDKFFRLFANANPPWSSTHVHSAVNMAARRSYTKTIRRKRRTNYRRSFIRRRRFRRNRFAFGRQLVKRSYANTLAIPSTASQALLLAQAGGVARIGCNTGTVYSVAEDLPKYTHFKIIKCKITMVPEPHSPPTYDEVMKNQDWTSPLMMRFWTEGTEVPKTVKGFIGIKGVRAMDPTKPHSWSFVPKFLTYRVIGTNNTVLSQKPRSHWLPIGTAAGSINGMVIGWDAYTIPNTDRSASLRYKVITSYVIKYAKFNGHGLKDPNPLNFLTVSDIQKLQK